MPATAYAQTSLALKQIPTDGSGRGTLRAYVSGAPDTEPLLDAGSLFSNRPTLPLLWMHRSEEPLDTIGAVRDFRWNGPEFLASFALDLENPRAETLYGQLLRDVPYEISVGFTWSKDDEYTADGRLHLRRAELLEISIVAAGANRATAIVNIKRAAGGHRPHHPAASVEQRLAALGVRDTSRPAETVAESKARWAREYPDGWNEVLAAEARERAAAAKAERARLRREQWEAEQRGLLGRGRSRVVIDSQFRIISEEDADERERDQRDRELADIERRAAERDAEYRERKRVSTLPPGDDVRRYEGTHQL